MKHTVTEYKLDSGAQGLVVNVPGTSVVNINVRFNSGFQFADAAFYELPHVVEHMMGCGSKKYPAPNEFKIEFQKNGAYRNAHTSSDMNGYVAECAEFELDRILDLFEEYLAEPLFPEEAFATEISNVREELNRLTTQHGAVCSMALSEKSFPHEDLNYEARIAQLADFRYEQVREYYERTHTRGNARFYISGSFEDGGAAVVKRLDAILERLPEGKRLELRQDVGLGQAAPIVTQRDIKQIYYRMASYSGEYPWRLRNALQILRVVLTGGFGSRIYGEARRRGLAYYVESGAHAGPGSTSFGFEGYVTATNIEELFKLIAEQYRAVRRGEVTEEELEAAKNLVIGSSLRAHQTAGDMLGWYLGAYDRENIILDYDKYHEDLRKVTREEVVEMANNVVMPGAQGMSLLGDVTEEQAAGYAKLLAPMWGKD